MLLFADGFENFDVKDLGQKWDAVSFANSNIMQTQAQIIPNSERKGKRCFFNHNHVGYKLTKQIKKSRTVYCGMALKLPDGFSSGVVGFRVHFYSAENMVARCLITLSTNAINFAWQIGEYYSHSQYTYPLTDIEQQYLSMDVSKDPKSGFLYYQFGITVNGNAANDEDCTAWVESRVTSSNDNGKIDNIRTALYEHASSYWIDSVSFELWGYDAGSSGSKLIDSYLDDIYICNSEGSNNNDFLGDVRIRAMIPENTGSINNASMVGFEGSRHLGVACDFVNTIDEVPGEWNYDEYPDLIEYANPFDYFLRMNEEAIQLFQMTNPNYAGAEPEIFGVVATTLCRAHEDIGKKARLELLRRHSTDPIETSTNQSMEKPIRYYEDWDSYTLAMDNTEELVGTQQSQKWIPSAISADQWGIKLVDWSGDPTDYLPGFLRLQQNHDEILYDYLDTIDFSHRHWDRELIEALLLTDFTGNYWAHYLYESIFLSEFQTVTKRVHHGVGEVLYIIDSLPWYYLYLKEFLHFDLKMISAWGSTMVDSLAFVDSSYHEWVEELISELYPTSSKAVIDIIVTLIDNLNLTEPLVWDNHETVEETIEAVVSYLWTNHEQLIDYLTYTSSDPIAGWGHDVESSMAFIDDHFDGWWVEIVDDGMKMWFEGITQHWRYEWFIGVIISSIKVAPIEDTGQWGGDGEDGDRVGYNEW